MSYARWSHSDWYIYADVRGGLTIHPRRTDSTYNLSSDEVSGLITGVNNIYQVIPETIMVPGVSYDELILCMHQYLKDERNVFRDDFNKDNALWRRDELEMDIDILEKSLEAQKKKLKEFEKTQEEIELGLLGARR